MYRTDKLFMKNPATASSRIYIGNIAETVVAADLEDKFKTHGNLLGLVLQRGFGFVQFADDWQAQAAIRNEHGTMFHGRKLNVRQAVDKSRLSNNQQQNAPSSGPGPGPQKPPPQLQQSPQASPAKQQGPPPVQRPSPPRQDAHEKMEEDEPEAGEKHEDLEEPNRHNDNMDERRRRTPRGRPPRNARSRDRDRSRMDFDRNFPDDFGGRDMPPRDMPPRDMPPRDMPPRDVPPRDMPPRDIPPRDMPPRDLPPRDMPPRDMLPRDGPPRDGPPPFYGREDGFRPGFIPPVLERPDRNDCEIIVVSKLLTEYAEYIEKRLKSIGLVVDLLFPNEDVPLGRVLANISSRGCLYAILVMPQNEEYRSLTLSVLHGLSQEHRNIPVDDAIALIARNFDAYMRGDKTAAAPGAPSLTERHPEQIQMLLNLLAENRQLATPQYDRLLKYLQERRELQRQFEVTEKGSDANADGEPDSKQAELQSRIMNILNKSADEPPKPVEPPAQPPGPTPLLNDPSVQKALDSLLLGDMFKTISSGF